MTYFIEPTGRREPPRVADLAATLAHVAEAAGLRRSEHNDPHALSIVVSAEINTGQWILGPFFYAGTGDSSPGGSHGEQWHYNWKMGGRERSQDPAEVHEVVEAFRDLVEPEEFHNRQIGPALEAFALAWDREGHDARLSAEDRRTADALAEMLRELAKTEHPPRAVLREAMLWFGHKLDVFSESFAKAAGATAGAGVGVTATTAAIRTVLDLLAH